MKKLKSTILLQIFQSRWSILVYYGVILLVFALNTCSAWFFEGREVSINGTEFSTAVFLFITAAIFMKIQFPFFLQNGISRRTTFVGSILAGGVFAVGMTLFTQLIALLAHLVSSNISTTFFAIYSERYGYHYNPPAFFEGLVWNFAMNLMFYLIGLFFSALMYRLNRILKTVVFAGLGALALFLPALDVSLGNGQIIQSLGRAFLFCMGLLENCNPFYAVATFLILGALFAAGEYLFLRRATVKK